MGKDNFAFGKSYIWAAVAVIGASTVALADQGPGQSMKGGQGGDPSEVTRTIRIEALDIAFDRKRLRVKEGETVRFIIANTGEMVHDFTLGTPDVQETHVRQMMEMKETLHGGPTHGRMMHDDANAVQIGPGETKELIWKFAEADDFEFRCNQPGHLEAGMGGRIDIED